MNLFVTAIGTDSGKTLISAILVEALGAGYWKPVQAGEPKDMDQVKALVTKEVVYHPERYVLEMPASPHAAARHEGVEISLEDFGLPGGDDHLIVEGAGGALVPLNDQDVVIDLAKRLGLEVVVIANFYLGSINHTLLTYEVLRQRGIAVKGVIFNGEMNKESERIILLKTGWKKLLHVKQELTIDRSVVRKYADELKKELG